MTKPADAVVRTPQKSKVEVIADYLRERILDGTFPVGQPLPSEEALAKEYGCSRPTVQKAVAILRSEGLIVTEFARGSFVRSPFLRPSVTRTRGVRRDASGQYTDADGLRWTSAEQPVATRTDAPVELADLLGITPGEPMFTYETNQNAERGRLRQLHRTYVPFSVVADTPMENTTPPRPPELYAAFEKLGHRLHWTEYVRARMPLPDEAHALKLTPGIPLLYVLRLTLNHDSRPLALEEIRTPGDELEFAYTFGPTGATGPTQPGRRVPRR